MSDAVPTEVADVRALLDLVELEGIDVYEVRARTVNRPEGFDEGYTIKAGIDVTTGQMRTRFSMTFNASEAEYFVDLGAVYSLASPVEVPQPLAIEFAERVGIMSAYPFLREQVFGLATRLGQPVPVLGLLRQGMFTLSVEKPDDTAAIDLPGDG